MLLSIDISLVDWSRAQFAMTAMYHWLFVPLTLGLAMIMGVMETIYYHTGKLFWKRTTQFWMRLFGVNFAIGIATGLILEFEFGTNWSNYSWLVGDIFGAPLAIEGILAFFMEATFVAVMFFGWEKVNRRFHLVSTWLTALGATLSAWWILVANAWMQYPIGMTFNPNTVRNEMTDFFAVAFSPVAIIKFIHTVLSSWIVGAAFVIGVSCWYLLKQRHQKFALTSIKIAATFGLFASVVTAWSGDSSGNQVAQVQPMKLAAAEGLYEGKNRQGLVAIGALNPQKKHYADGKEPFLFKIEIPAMLSILATRDINGYVPGIQNIIEGGYPLPNGQKALSTKEKIERGQKAITSLSNYRQAKKQNNNNAAMAAYNTLQENIAYFGYGYVKDSQQLVPNVPLCFYSFRIMVLLGGYFLVFFTGILILTYRKQLITTPWIQWVGIITIPLAYIASQAGWIVAEAGRQPWTIQDMLPTWAAISKLPTSSVQITFFIFLALFTVLFIAGISILIKSIRKGPSDI